MNKHLFLKALGRCSYYKVSVTRSSRAAQGPSTKQPHGQATRSLGFYLHLKATCSLRDWHFNPLIHRLGQNTLLCQASHLGTMHTHHHHPSSRKKRPLRGAVSIHWLTPAWKMSFSAWHLLSLHPFFQCVSFCCLFIYMTMFISLKQVEQ